MDDESAAVQRKSWTWGEASMTPEQRQARAAEYIAYYLDRIDMHLGSTGTGTNENK